MRTIALLFALAATAAAQTSDPQKDPAADRKAAALRALKAVTEGLAEKTALAEAEGVVRDAAKDAVDVDWGQERKQWSEPALALLAAAKERARRAAGHDPPYPEAAARYLRIAVAIAASLKPEELPPADLMNLVRDTEEAVENWLFGNIPPTLPPAKDLLAKEWTWKEGPGIESKRDEQGWHLKNTGGGPAVVELAEDVHWADFRIQIEFVTNDEGFVMMQRTGPGGLAAVQHDIRLLMSNGGIKAGEATTVNFWTYGNHFRVMKDKPSGRPGRCAPGGPRSGGILLRLGPGSDLVIRSLKVTVVAEEK